MLQIWKKMLCIDNNNTLEEDDELEEIIQQIHEYVDHIWEMLEEDEQS